MPTQEQLHRLLEKYATGSCTTDEVRQLKSWFNQIGSEPMEELSEAGQQRMLNAFRDNPRFRKKDPARILAWPVWQRIVVAASLIGIVGLTGLWYISNQATPKSETVKNDIRPGGSKALLTLADGRKVILDSVNDENISNQSGSTVIKTKPGLLTYTVTSMPKMLTTGKSIAYNSIETPLGGQYQVILTDGTKVWLNAASSIRFPAAFTAAERKVEITGEVYLEVAKNPKRPFLVVTDKQTVEVLGTHFNVKAYSNDPSVITTLLEGSVKVTTKDNIQKILAPGQRAVLHANSIMVEETNTDNAVAWKNGYFRFHDEKIESVMRQLSRWYNIEVNYEGPRSDEEFNGRISRAKNISQVLKMLEKTKGVHFKIAERKVTVMQ